MCEEIFVREGIGKCVRIIFVRGDIRILINSSYKLEEKVTAFFVVL